MTSSIKYTAGDVAGGFAGAASFSPEAAAAVASKLNKAGDLGSMDPDDAARAVQAAVHAGTGGATVSIDLSLAALNAIHARKGAEGQAVGFTDQPGADAEPAKRELTGAAKAAADRKAEREAAATAGNG